ncbi:MAG TPA: hypothetical protein PLF26_10910 [Blastocatellia bacterium]|nr:hypothetical protein [Blastocatellia bacterium]
MTSPDVILEPLSTGDIIDRSVRIYRQNVRPLLATVLVPFLVGALGWLMMQFGKSNLSIDEPTPGTLASSIILVGGGFVVWLLYAYLMVLTVAGLSRTIGDYLMLGKPITVRASVVAVRSRIGDLTLGSLFLAGSVIVGSIIMMGVFFVAMLVVGIVTAALAWLQLPQQLTGVLAVVVLLAAFGFVILVVVPSLLARVVFIPQAIMIEGCSASTALSRAIELGARNWNRVLAILIFSYFTGLSLAAAVLAPIALLLWLSGYLVFDTASFEAVTGGVQQFSSFLVVPVWSIAYTLLYFDSRVRREGYDVDLLARRLPPPPVPRAVPAPAFAYGAPQLAAPVQSGFARTKFASDGRCLRCGRYNLFNSANCPGCGW